jgi:hypothetical protein
LEAFTDTQEFVFWKMWVEAGFQFLTHPDVLSKFWKFKQYSLRIKEY